MAYPYASVLIYAYRVNCSQSVIGFLNMVPESGPRWVVTNLGSVGKECGLGSVCRDGLVIEADCRRPIASSERLVSLVLEVDGCLRHCEAGYPGLEHAGR